MWPMIAPSMSVGSVLATCIGNIEPENKAKFAAISSLLETAAKDFANLAAANSLYTIPQAQGVGGVTNAQMTWLYDKKMAAQKSPGRPIYDQIKMAAQFGICPLCGRGVVYSLDHHLPKKKYPDLTIAPANLIPACQDCNKVKTQAAPQTASDETLHPYYDNVEGRIWLRARVIEVSPAALFFFADPPVEWPLTLRDRVRNHFRAFKLRSFYASVAAGLLTNIRGYLQTGPAQLGAEQVRQHLFSMAASSRINRLNTWEAAAYTAMGESDWYCNGGYGLTG